MDKITVYSPNPVNEMHLQKVMKDMVNIGKGPMIQAVDYGGFMVALEGAHRLEAARRLGFPVVFLPINRNEMLEKDSVPDLVWPWSGKQLAKTVGLRMRDKRPKRFTPVYYYDRDTALLELRYFPTCGLTDVREIAGKVALLFAAILALTIFWLT